MKMWESTPAQVPPFHHGGLFLTCLTVVSLLVTKASGSYQEQSNIIPGNLMASNLSSPPTAVFIMECISPGGRIWDHCWLDDNTIVMVHYQTKKVIKATINRVTKTCTHYIYPGTPPSPHRLACSPDREEIYVVNHQRRDIWIYDRNSLKAVWTPDGLQSDPYILAVNSERIIIGTYGKSAVYSYNNNREYLGRISILQNQFFFEYSHLTEEGLFVACADKDHKVVIHDIPNDSTVTVGGWGSENGQFKDPHGITNIGDYLLVCDHGNNRVSIFSKNGGFQNNLQLNGTVMEEPHAIAYRSETKLLSISADDSASIKIFY